MISCNNFISFKIMCVCRTFVIDFGVCVGGGQCGDICKTLNKFSITLRF